jgi:hypothetical protein
MNGSGANERTRVSRGSGAGIVGTPASDRVRGFGDDSPPDEND